MSKYTQVKDGDDIEKYCWLRFLKTDFPHYEKFWQDYIVELTNRPQDIHFKTNQDLRTIGKNEYDICMAQLHYTVLVHLKRVYEIIEKNPKGLSKDKFMEGIIRLCASLDVADELLERFTSSRTYNPWSEQDGRSARVAWRKNHSEMQYLRDYRNRLIHGRMQPTISIIGGTYPRHRFPKFGKQDNYLDWRKVTGASIGTGGRVRNDFDAPTNLLNKTWKDTLEYLEQKWRSYLI